MQAFKFFTKAAQNGSEEEKAINAAIHIVSTSGDDQLALQLAAFLEGSYDNVPKDGKYLFRFYLARGQLKEAAKTAIVIAGEEQNAGNYRDAHALLQRMYQVNPKCSTQMMPYQSLVGFYLIFERPTTSA